MVDHPLVPTDLRQYIQHHKIEETLNNGLNNVLRTFPVDPFSMLSVTLIDVSILFNLLARLPTARLRLRNLKLLKRFLITRW